MATREQEHSIIVLGPMERGESSKAEVFHEVLILDDVRATFLPELLHHLAKQRIKAEGMEAGLWTFNAKDYLSVWRTCVSTLGIEGLAMSPYQTRHGGASRDDLMGLRTIPEIRRRGRWASDSSARICDKPGGLQQMSSMYEGRYRELGEKIRLNFANFYHNGGVVLPRGLKAPSR